MIPEDYMKQALLEAQKAFELEEVPVGAIVVKDSVIIGRGYNLIETTKDATAHAEMLAIRDAAKNLGVLRLTGCQLYVTTEPCAMCAGAIVLARIEKVFIGTMDAKTGAAGSLMNILQDERLNHFVEIETGLLERECQAKMKQFFKILREKPGRRNT